jgi:ferritin
MISKKVEKALNKQLQLEAESSHFYLSMASWAESNGLSGVAKFLYRHSDEERFHMLKMLKYINERGGEAVLSAIPKPPFEFKDVQELFKNLLNHELKVSSEINSVVQVCLEEKDYTTHNFVQWYVSEQIEEEALARTIMDKLKLIGSDKGGLYLFDRDLETFTGADATKNQKN